MKKQITLLVVGFLLVLFCTASFSVPAEEVTKDSANTTTTTQVSIESTEISKLESNTSEVLVRPFAVNTNLVEVSAEVATSTVEAPSPTVEVEVPVGVGLLAPSNVTADQLSAALSGNLKNYSEYFIEAEQTTGVNAVYLAAIAASESGWGESRVALSKNNLFGWTQGASYRSFSSVEECISFCSQKLKENYLTEGGCYFEGYYLEDVNVHYNGSQHWIDLVSSVYRGIQSKLGS